MTKSENESVRAWEEGVTIPTYPKQAPDKNPMFFEKRVYQGSSGKVYPNPVTDRVSNEKSNRVYNDPSRDWRARSYRPGQDKRI